ncbi:MAG: neutral/alkaline non-lysosomal ceramidase N-terminal domain-containing protein [Planctomycetia bacterium]|nr:neutral/alkaline non-lysosomal ceramidase N-terminal domain-containing protein [Planctomycetia bacterium]
MAILRWILSLFLTTLLLHANTPSSAPAPRKAWRAGTARAIITPQTKVWLAGYGTKREPTGKLHELWMKALALEDEYGHQVVLITSDFQGIPKEMSDRVFQQLKQQLQLERQQVMITFSHNHCGPRLGSDLVDYYPVEPAQEKLVEEYTKLMEERIVKLVADALKDLAPAHLNSNAGHATFAVNRRNNREADVPEMLKRGSPFKGPVDHTVPVITVARADHSLKAIVFGYACHPTTLSFTQWCGDYPGFAQLAIEQQHPHAMAMFVNTCGGDQNPLPRRTVELCEKYGKTLAQAVGDAIKKPAKPIDAELRYAFEFVDLPFELVVTRKQLQDSLKDSNAIKQRWAQRLLKKLDRGETFPSAYPYPIHVWRLGELWMIGQGAETVVDYALQFKSHFGKETWVLGYVDDMAAYIPSRRVWDEGGYEGGSYLYEYGRPALRWAGDIETRITRTVYKLAESLK